MPHLGELLELDPTDLQRQRFSRAAGCARLAYNWALARWRLLQYRQQPRHWQDLQKAFVAERDSTYPFLREVPACCWMVPVLLLTGAWCLGTLQASDRAQP